MLRVSRFRPGAAHRRADGAELSRPALRRGDADGGPCPVAAGEHGRILDTRKTTPGLRLLEKAAVAPAVGSTTAIGLFDAILIKENHTALAAAWGRRCGARRAAGRTCRSR